MGKGEIARHEQFLLFPQCFQKACFPGASKGVIEWEWVKSKRKMFSFHVKFAQIDRQTTVKQYTLIFQCGDIKSTNNFLIQDNQRPESLHIAAFSPFPQCFLCPKQISIFWVTFLSSSANAFNLYWFEILSICKELTFFHTFPTLNDLEKEAFENIVVKGENAGKQHFLISPLFHPA